MRLCKNYPVIKKSFIKLFLLTLITLFSPSCENKNPDNLNLDSISDLIITTSTVNESFTGNGVQWGGYDLIKSWTGNSTLSDADWNKLFQRVRFMHPSIVRLMAAPGWNYITGGNFDPLKSEPVLLKILDFCEAEGITVLFGEWGHKGGNTIDETWLENSAKFIEWLLNTKNYTCIKYYNMVNEPNGYWSSINGNYSLWKTLIEEFHAKLVEKGIDSKIKIIGPDIAIWDQNSTLWVTNSNSDLGSKIGMYDIHTYPPETQVREGTYQDMVRAYKAVAPSSKEMLVAELGFKYPATSELGKENKLRISKDPFASDDCNMFIYDAFYGIDMADAMIQNMLAGFSGTLAWDMDDAMYNIDGSNGTLLKRWGFWNILGAEKFGNANDENIRPWFYTMSLLCRYFPEGTKIYDVNLPYRKGLRAIAGEKDGKYTIAVVNSSSISYNINLKMENGAVLSSVKSYKYISGSEASFIGKTDSNGFAVPDETNLSLDFQNGGSRKIYLPGQSFYLLTNIE